MRACRWLLSIVVGAVVGCGGSSSPVLSALPSLSDPGIAQTYVAIGASETVGAGIDDDALRLRDEWPQLFYNAALSRTSTLVNLGIPGATTASALSRELPQALAAHPTVATVWLNVDDLVRAVPVATYEQQLHDLVRALRGGGATTVLVANTPILTHLPAIVACRSAATNCPLPPGTPVPSDAVLDATVDAYNAAIERVVTSEGAVLVDLHAQGDVAITRPELIASDGFHPSFQGHVEVARLFASAYAARSR